MKQKELEFILERNEYLKGGTKEACVKVRDFLFNAKNPGNQLQSPLSCVNVNEFVKAVEVLMAFAFQQEDQIPETWHCNNDCHRCNELLCPGECNISEEAEKLCPYFMDEGLI